MPSVTQSVFVATIDGALTAVLVCSDQVYEHASNNNIAHSSDHPELICISGGARQLYLGRAEEDSIMRLLERQAAGTAMPATRSPQIYMGRKADIKRIQNRDFLRSTSYSLA